MNRVQKFQVKRARPAKLMPKFPFFGKKKLMLAFEYGVTIARVAQEQGIEMTPALIEKAEIMLEGEARAQTATHMAVNMLPNILSAFELDLSK